MIDTLLEQSYVTLFSMLLIGAPTLVGIVSPLISRVIKDLEKVRLEKLRDLQSKAHERATARNEKELGEAQEKLKNATKEYNRIKSATSYLNISIFAGIVIVGVCSLALFSLFASTTSQNINYEIFLGFAVGFFMLESLCLLAIVVFYIVSIQKEAVEELGSRDSTS